MEQSQPDETGKPLRVVEATASPGDVYLCNPFLYHTVSQNHSGAPRFMCNRTTPLRERMTVHALTEDSSPVERSIYHALEGRD
jgi:ectoine hydroxylase-related dioxygenase (phytanoyl-CoA dioxygenase family)